MTRFLDFFFCFFCSFLFFFFFIFPSLAFFLSLFFFVFFCSFFFFFSFLLPFKRTTSFIKFRLVTFSSVEFFFEGLSYIFFFYFIIFFFLLYFFFFYTSWESNGLLVPRRDARGTVFTIGVETNWKKVETVPSKIVKKEGKSQKT